MNEGSGGRGAGGGPYRPFTESVTTGRPGTLSKSSESGSAHRPHLSAPTPLRLFTLSAKWRQYYLALRGFVTIG